MNGGLDRQAHAQELSQRLPGVTTILTGSRCTILVKLPVALLGAAAPHSSLAFMFWGEGIFVYPLMLIYMVISYRVFRGKVRGALRAPPAARLKSNLGS